MHRWSTLLIVYLSKPLKGIKMCWRIQFKSWLPFGLRGCKDKASMYAAAEKRPENLQDVLREVCNAAANLCVLWQS